MLTDFFDFYFFFRTNEPGIRLRHTRFDLLISFGARVFSQKRVSSFEKKITFRNYYIPSSWLRTLSRREGLYLDVSLLTLGDGSSMELDIILVMKLYDPLSLAQVSGNIRLP